MNMKASPWLPSVERWVDKAHNIREEACSSCRCVRGTPHANWCPWAAIEELEKQAQFDRHECGAEITWMKRVLCEHTATGLHDTRPVPTDEQIDLLLRSLAVPPGWLSLSVLAVRTWLHEVGLVKE